MTASVTLTSAQYDILWADLGLGEQPYPIAVRSHGRTMQERVLIRNRVYGELTARRLADGPRPDPGLADALSLLVEARVSVDMTWLPERHATAMRNALAVAAGDRGLLAELTVDGLRLHAVRAQGIVASLLELLPRVPAAPGRSITVPTEALSPAGPPAAGATHATSAQDTIYQPERPSTATGQQVRSLEALFAKPRLRGGQIVANVRDPRGARRRSRPLEWFDTEDGRSMAQTGTGADGRQHLLVAPADDARIAYRVYDMLAAFGAAT